MFVNHGEEYVIYPLPVNEIAQTQAQDATLKSFKNITSIPLIWSRLLSCYARMAG